MYVLNISHLCGLASSWAALGLQHLHREGGAHPSPPPLLTPCWRPPLPWGLAQLRDTVQPLSPRRVQTRSFSTLMAGLWGALSETLNKIE